MRVFAAIDCGSNSFHLLVVKVDEANQTWEAIARDKEVLRLAEDDSGSRISTLAMERGIDVLRRFKERADALGAERIIAVATSAIREARNGDAFLERAEREAGVPINLISGAEEARLIYLGVASSFNFAGRKVAIVDIGGGSTELIVGTATELLLNRSVKLGAVHLTAQYHDHDPISADGYQEMLLDIHHGLQPVTAEMRRIGFDVLVGTSGTIENLAAIDAARQGAECKPGYEMSYAHVREMERSLRGMSYEERLDVRGMSPRRADIVVAGARVLRTVMDQLDVESVQLCDRALREGVVLDLLYREGILADVDHAHDQVRSKSIREVGARYRCDLVHGERVAKLALAMFDQLAGLHGVPAAYRDVLEGAAVLHEVGQLVSRDIYHRHTYYLLRHTEFLGFHDDEIRLMANLARYHRKSLPKKKHENYMEMSFDHRMVARRLIAILRMARALSKSRTGAVDDLTLRVEGNRVIMVLHAAGNVDVELRSAQEKAEVYAKYLGVDVQLEVNPLGLAAAEVVS
ncbi:MAG: ppx [Cyanobacteria bacterium RYN_339]|nr:ppx [Cyanobacteria bacterium RYN_339]